MTREQYEELVLALEKAALTGSKPAIVTLVSIRRRTDQLAMELLSKRYSDGECDAVALHQFQDGLGEMYEHALLGEDDDPVDWT